MEQYFIDDLAQLNALAIQLKTTVLQYQNILFYGEMGAGKTTFIKALCTTFDIQEAVSSPTYSIVNEYQVGPLQIFHFDLFRLKSQEELLDIGFEDYLDSDAICLIEWPQLAEPLIESGLKIEIEKIDLNKRKFSIFKF